MVPCKIVKVEPINWPTRLQVLVDNGKGVTNPVTSLRDGLTGLFDVMPAGVEMSMYLTTGAPRAAGRARSIDLRQAPSDGL
jgi:hypothetical protein